MQDKLTFPFFKGDSVGAIALEYDNQDVFIVLRSIAIRPKVYVKRRLDRRDMMLLISWLKARIEEDAS